MIKKFLLATVLSTLLISCAGKEEPILSGVTPVRVPDLPTELSQPAGRLPDITDNTMGGQVTSGIEADIAYNDVAYRYNSLITLYTCVATAVNEKKDPEQCLKK